MGVNLYRRRSAIVRHNGEGQQLSVARIANAPDTLERRFDDAGPHPEVVLEATHGWYWALDALQAAGPNVHLAHPLGVKGFRYHRVKNNVRDASDLADVLRMNRLPEEWIAPPEVRELRELVAIRSNLKA